MRTALMRPCARPAPFSAVRRSRSSCVRVQASDGVSELLERDRKLSGGNINVSPELEGAAAAAKQATTAAPSDPVVKSRKQRQEERVKKAQAAQVDPSRPKTCKQAIDEGLALFQKKEYAKAIEMFSAALELPGNGAYRLPDSPREYSCPSDAEENAALYNMACAYAQMGQKASAMTCIEAVLENEFNDFDTIRNDPDLAPLKGMELDMLLFRFQNPMAKVRLPFLPGQNKPQKSDTNKPWLMW